MDRPPCLVVFDFDWSLLDENSDTWLINRLAPALLHDCGKRATSWPDFMHFVLGEIFDLGYGKESVLNSFDGIPMDSSLKRTINELSLLGHEMMIVSGGMDVFIQHILELHRIPLDIFSAIHAHPCVWDDDGRLSIGPYHDDRAEEGPRLPHTCEMCPPELCKGTILAHHISKKYHRVIYVGDSRNDICPCLSLSKGDVVLAREGRHLSSVLNREDSTLKAKLFVWNDQVHLSKLLKEHTSLGDIIHNW